MRDRQYSLALIGAEILATALVGLSLACGGSIHPPSTPPSGPPSTPPPSSTPPPLAPTYTVACVVTDADTQHPVEGAECVSGFQKVLTNGDGYGAMQLGSCRDTKDAPEHCGWMQVNASGYVSFMDRFENAPHPENPTGNQDRHIALTPDAPTLPRIRQAPDAPWAFGLENGERFSIRGTSEYLLYQLFLDHPSQADDLLQHDVEDLGFNLVVVYGMKGGYFSTEPVNFDPQEYGERYWTDLPAFFRLAAKHHVYVQFIAFAAAARTMPSAEAETAYWARLTQVLQPVTNLILTAQNEADQADNKLAIDPPRPEGIFASHGSMGAASPIGVRPWWDCEELHLNDANEWWRKPHNAMELTVGADGLPPSHVPAFVSETTRTDSRNMSADRIYDYGAVCTLLTGGCVFHSYNGRFARALTDTERALAASFIAGVSTIPLECQPGPYGRPNDSTVLRRYTRGNDPRCAAVARK